jgi:hypothetical protein
VSSGLNSQNPPSRRTFFKSNDGNLNHSPNRVGCSSNSLARLPPIHSTEAIVAVRQQPPAREALTTEGLRFENNQKPNDDPDVERVISSDVRAPTTAERWKLWYSSSSMLRPDTLDAKTGKGARGPAVCGCGYGSMEKENVTIHLREAGARKQAGVSGVYKCDSPWLCPKCAPRMSAKRQANVRKVVEATVKLDGQFAHVVLTVRHRKSQTLAELKAAVLLASRMARRGAAWKKIQASMKAAGVLVAPEVTFSLKKGWHFHVHLALPCLTEDLDAIYAGCEAMVARYLQELKKLGFSATWRGQDISITNCPAEAARYVAKGITWEISGGVGTKTDAKSGSLTPFEIAALAVAGDPTMRARWREYAAAMPGTVSCRVSAEMARALKISELDDSDDAGEPAMEFGDDDTSIVGTLPTFNWNALLRRGHAPTLFERLEKEGRSAWTAIREWAVNAGSSDAGDVNEIPFGFQVQGLNVEPHRRQSPPDFASDIADQCKTTLGAQKLIKNEIARLERDHVKFRGPRPPTVLEIAHKLRARIGVRGGAPPGVVIEWRRNIQIPPSEVHRDHSGTQSSPGGGHHA